MTQNLNNDPSKIQHDPLMWVRYVEAINAQIEFEIELIRRDNVQEIRPTSASK